jgi:3-hydroxyisobutyrate dehydrogenase
MTIAKTGANGTVGFIGLGVMGGPMCRRLAASGFDVRAYDVDPAAVARVAGDGVLAVASSSELASAQRVVTMLPDGKAVMAALFDEEPALADALAPGSIVIDTSSSAPQDTRRTSAELSRRSVALVDAPVSGSPEGAGRGELTLMAGGRPETLDEVAPLLDALGTVRRVGDVGAGHSLKALNNLLGAVNLAAAVEVLLAAEHHGIDPAVALDVINMSTGRNHATEHKIRQFVLSQSYDSGFLLRLMAKDIAIAIDLVHEAGVPAELAEACSRIWADATRLLPRDADNVEVARVLSDRTQAHHDSACDS